MKTFHKTIVFTKTPLTGYFRYRDEFQVYPADLDNMPKSKMQKHFPVILEYVTSENDVIKRKLEDVPGLEDLMTHTATTITKEENILNLLTLFTNHLFFRYRDLTGCWGVPILNDDPGEEANTWSAKWIHTHFHWPELPDQLKIMEFSDPIVPEVKFVKHFDYFFLTPNYDNYSGKVITFPISIVDGLNAYHNLREEIKGVIDSAISYSVSAVELRTQRKTLSIISAFTAVETLVNYEYRNSKPETCKPCGQLKYKVAKKFRDFLLKYLGDSPENKKKFISFYSLRSKFVHTGEQLMTEKLFADVSKDKADNEYLTHIEIIGLSKLAIIHWLILRHRKIRV